MQVLGLQARPTESEAVFLQTLQGILRYPKVWEHCSRVNFFPQQWFTTLLIEGENGPESVYYKFLIHTAKASSQINSYNLNNHIITFITFAMW